MAGTRQLEPAFLIEAMRSRLGRGKPGGALSEVHPVELLAQVLVSLVERTGIDPGRVDDVIVGWGCRRCARQAGWRMR